MTEQNASPELERLKQEITSLRSQVEKLQNTVNHLSQSQRTDQATSAQEQFAQEIQARSQNPDQNIEQYSGR